MRLRYVSALLISMVATTTDATAGQDGIAAGRRLAIERCGSCHLIGRRIRQRPAVGPRFRDIAARYSVWDLQEALAEGIVVGHAAMPKFVLSPREIHALLSYMDTLTPSKRRVRRPH